MPAGSSPASVSPGTVDGSGANPIHFLKPRRSPISQAAPVPENLHDTRTDMEALRDTFRTDVIEGLTRPAGSKSVPPKHLYDDEGSVLFERICELPEYYPTRTEAGILRDSIDQIAEALGRNVTLVEPGAGAAEKSEDVLVGMRDPSSFVPIEISLDALERASIRIARRLPELSVYPLCADFHCSNELLGHVPDERRAVFFPGSTIGNLTRAQRLSLLGNFAKIVGEGGQLLLGYDLVKDRDALRAAYDDRAGVTAAFNLNLIDRINREFDAGLDREAFVFAPRWSEQEKRIESYLRCTADQRTELDGEKVSIDEGEHIHTEYSHKFTHADMEREAGTAGFRITERWTDEREWFGVALYELSG